LGASEGYEKPAMPRDAAGEEAGIGGIGCCRSCVVAMTMSCREWESIAPTVKLDAPTAAPSKTFSPLRLLKLLAVPARTSPGEHGTGRLRHHLSVIQFLLIDYP